MRGYVPFSQEQWSGRPDGLRLHQVIRAIDYRQGLPAKDRRSIAFVGFACDEGVRRNYGRPGAAEGPRVLRRMLANLPLHLKEPWDFFDLGDIVCEAGDLESAQESLGELLAELYRGGFYPLVLGGGQELTWGQYKGIAAVYPRKDIGLVNIDAHFDLRLPLEGDKGTSGSSFWQIAQDRLTRGLTFDYLCLGLQEFSNTSSLFDQANELKTVAFLADVLHLGQTERVMLGINHLLTRSDLLFLSVDLDVFAAAFAPGVSAPQAMGLYPWQIYPLIAHIAQSGKAVGFGISELAPGFDPEGRTTQLAAALIARYIHSLVFQF